MSFGVFGFSIKELIVIIAPNIDAIAMSVVLSGVIVRLSIGRQRLYSGTSVKPNTILFNLLWASSFSFVTTILVTYTGLRNIGWAISAFSLIVLFSREGAIPITHHITMITGHALYFSESIIVAVIFGACFSVFSELIDTWMNQEFDTLIDMPSVLIVVANIILVFVF